MIELFDHHLGTAHDASQCRFVQHGMHDERLGTEDPLLPLSPGRNEPRRIRHTTDRSAVLGDRHRVTLRLEQAGNQVGAMRTNGPGCTRPRQPTN